MARSAVQLVSLTAIVIGIVLFVVTLIYIDLDETIASAGRLGLALPVILLPATVWQFLRTWGWALSFPDDTRPPFTRLLRVRLAADAIGFFTVRGIAGEPLKVVLLYDRVAPEVTTAAIALERLAFAVIGIVIAALRSGLARQVGQSGAAALERRRPGHWCQPDDEADNTCQLLLTPSVLAARPSAPIQPSSTR